MLIIYTDGSEAIICTPETEQETIKMYFTKGGRDLDEYDRTESIDCAVEVSSRVHIW